MGYGVSVKKIFEDNYSVKYEAETGDFGGLHYFISVKKGERKIYIYKDIDLKNLLGLIDLNIPDEVIKVSGIPQKALIFNVIKLIRNMKNNEYPDCLDYICG